MELFWRQGYSQTSPGDLCKAMNIKAPSFYCAFGTKEKLFLETFRHYKQSYWDKALVQLLEEKDLRKALKDFLFAVVRIYLRPKLPRGCFADISTVGLSASESRILSELDAMNRESRELFRSRLLKSMHKAKVGESLFSLDCSQAGEMGKALAEGRDA